MRRFTLAAVAVALALAMCGTPVPASAAPAVQQGQQDPPPATAPQTTPLATGSQAPPSAPLEQRDLNRIKNALSGPPPLKLDEDQLRFYVRVIAKEPRFEDFIKGYDLMYGPVPGAQMTHQEFLNMVTPRELYGSGGITATDLLQWSLTNWLGQAIIRKGLEALRLARSEAEVRAIRQRIDRELAALAGKFN
jgi:hypothetical protein